MEIRKFHLTNYVEITCSSNHDSCYMLMYHDTEKDRFSDQIKLVMLGTKCDSNEPSVIQICNLVNEACKLMMHCYILDN